MISALPKFSLLLVVATGVSFADETRVEFDGHAKFRVEGLSFPSDSLFHDSVGSESMDTQGELRLNLETRRNGWTFQASYQLVAMSGKTLRVPSDERRFFDLSATMDESSTSLALHRLDRLWVGYTGEKTVLRFGRQALSWGNGLFYAPMDLVNPFDPAAVAFEYKAGDDMFYLQYLRDDGADVQGAYVIRRDIRSGDVDADQATTALKYHGFAASFEYDLLVAEQYGDQVAGLGLGRGIGGAQWGGDIVLTHTDLDTYVQLVTNVSYSWTMADRNMSGTFEYHFNGFGLENGDYNPLALAANPDLLVRLSRGELFTSGRHYLAASLMIELTPLWTVSPTLLGNITDPSALIQLVTNYSLSDNAAILGSLNIPLGSNGSEFGGIESGVPGRYLSSNAGVFVQLAWYF